MRFVLCFCTIEIPTSVCGRCVVLFSRWLIVTKSTYLVLLRNTGHRWNLLDTNQVRWLIHFFFWFHSHFFFSSPEDACGCFCSTSSCCRIGIRFSFLSLFFVSLLLTVRIVSKHNLSSIQSILSTGSPLKDESFDFIYDKVKHDVMLSSISGGTDIISCFVGGNPTLPVYRGEIQCRLLGMAVEAFDGNG